MSGDNIEQLYRIAKLYYNDNLSQEEISAREHISRSQISRMLKHAREIGMVQIHLSVPSSYKKDFLASRLKEILHLSDVVLFDTIPGIEANSLFFAKSTTEYVQSQIQEANTVGIGWGCSMFDISQNLSLVTDGKKRTFLSLIGASSTNHPCRQTNSIVDRFTYMYQAEPYYNNFKCCITPSQLSLTDRKRWDDLKAQWNRMDLAVIEIANCRSTLAEYLLEFDNPAPLKEAMVPMAGDILGHFYDKDGTEILYPNGARPSSPELSVLQETRKVICITSSSNKADSVRFAAAAGYFNILVTDYETGKTIWERNSESMADGGSPDLPESDESIEPCLSCS